MGLHPKGEVPGVWVVLLLACAVLHGCGRERPEADQGSPKTRVRIQTRGSDSMSHIAVAWAEEYRKVAPNVEVEVSGGGSATGFAALIQGSIQIAIASRPIQPREIELAARQHPDQRPRGTLVGYDALAVLVDRENPLEEIRIDQLRQIYAEGGSVTRWSQLGVRRPGGVADTIVLVSRQSSSGTYEFFREHVLDDQDFRQASHELNGSKEVVALVAVTPGAIGFCGMGYATTEVKALRVRAPDGFAYAPTIENCLSHKYPLTRPLFLYTLGEPQGPVRDYVDWVRSDAGQRIVASCGYGALPPSQRSRT